MAADEPTGYPTAHEVMLDALHGGGLQNEGLLVGERLWRVLLPEVERLEDAYAPDGPIWPEHEREIGSMLRIVCEGLLARHRYEAALNAKRNKRQRAKKKRDK